MARTSKYINSAFRILGNFAWLVIFYPYFSVIVFIEVKSILVPFRVLKWHHGAKTFTTAGHKKYFVKFDTDTGRLLNEAHWIKILSEKHRGFVGHIIAEKTTIVGHILIMDYFESCTLKRHAAMSTLEGKETVLLQQLVSVLKILSDHNMVHRDISPENILVHVAPDGTIKVRIIDFAYSVSIEPTATTENFLTPPEIEQYLSQDWRKCKGEWDDAYCTKKILSSLLSYPKKFEPVDQNLEKMVGKCVYYSRSVA